jgi:hypothetical protein
MVEIIAWSIFGVGFLVIVVPVAILGYILVHPKK